MSFKPLKCRWLLVIVSKKRLRSAEVFDLKGSNRKLYKSNKWSPKYKNLKGFKIALQETFEWFQEDKNLKKYTNIKKYNI